MNNDIVKGKWNELKGTVKQKWGDLTDDDLLEIEGNRERLVGKLQQRYGRSREDAETEARKFYDQAGWDW